MPLPLNRRLQQISPLEKLDWPLLAGFHFHEPGVKKMKYFTDGSIQILLPGGGRIEEVLH